MAGGRTLVRTGESEPPTKRAPWDNAVNGYELPNGKEAVLRAEARTAGPGAVNG
jgi:hypothetical protein